MTKRLYLGDIDATLDGRQAKASLVFEGMTRRVAVWDRQTGKTVKMLKNFNPNA